MPITMTGGDAALALLARYAPKEMQRKIKTAEQKAGRAIVPLVKREIDASIAGHGKKPGTLRNRVSVRQASSSLTGPAVRVRSFAPHAHLVIRGHRIVSHAGVDSGRRSRPNDFMDRVEPEARVIARTIMQREVSE